MCVILSYSDKTFIEIKGLIVNIILSVYYIEL